jgi:SAM-dependent methyltransferase
MGPEKKHLAYDAWENLAHAYAEQVDTKPHNAYLEKPATLSLLPDLVGKLVLDVGCGPGSKTEWLVGHGAKVTAIDASPKMVDYARKRLGRAVDVKLHDVEKPLTFLNDSSIDLVLAALVMDYVEDWSPVFSEFKRVLKDNGVLVFSVGHPFVDLTPKRGREDYFKVERFEMWWRTWRTNTDALLQAPIELHYGRCA